MMHDVDWINEDGTESIHFAHDNHGGDITITVNPERVENLDYEGHAYSMLTIPVEAMVAVIKMWSRRQEIAELEAQISRLRQEEDEDVIAA